MRSNKKAIWIVSLFILLISGSAYGPFAEGMFPLSEISKIDLNEAGLKIDKSEIYNPGDTSLIDALVKVGGCTGSFISAEGLILTNHHCAFEAVQLASTPENDYLGKGFIASERSMEIPAKGLTCRITESYEDVSEKVLQAVSEVNDPILRMQIIQQQMKQIADKAEKQDSTIQAEVSEMFTGKSYVLFRYKTIKDVRLVYVPRRSIGEFGGETDNWMWPRHTGDFAFLRAYVAPDSSSAEYSKDNIPYKPKRFLRVNPHGVNEEDFVFILGYPGRTFRHQPAQFIQYQQQYVLPYISDLYSYQNKVMEEAGKKDKQIELKLATRIKRNANVLKNYQGKLKGLKAIGLIEQKRQEDAALAGFINSKDSLKEKYGPLMQDIDRLYLDIYRNAYRDLWFSQIYRGVSVLAAARQINSFKEGMERNPDFYKENISKLEQQLELVYEDMLPKVDKAILTRMLTDASNFPNIQRVDAIDKQVLKSFNKQEQINRFLNSFFQYTRLTDSKYVLNTLIKSPHLLRNYNDRILIFEKELSSQLSILQKQKAEREGILNRLMADYLTAKELYQNKNFIPDANSTLRLTYGYIRGYYPRDSVYMPPFTAIKGIIEKGKTENPEYQYPDKIREVWQTKDFGIFADSSLDDVPVNMLYDMDTTGGNSGSPVMNAWGELIGLNFDRAQEATINDYAWNESYSRSIGVDIRYILWVTSKIDGADFILKELGI